ncbi:ABC transporter permease subunit [Halocella sp. SP3-1]|nr:ABC transporter permease subunit [Halocella sp. SP3-1]
MGVGQLYNRQWVKGILFTLLNFFIVLNSVSFLLQNLQGFISLGETPMEDHSLFMLVYGLLSLLLVLVVIGLYVFNIFDAYKNGKLRDRGKTPAKIKESFRNLIESGYPYIVLSPGLIAIIFITILPLIFSILIGFTSYDLYHLPPGSLFEWVGFKNFIEIFQISAWKNTFIRVALWTVVWAVLSTVTTYFLGAVIAVVLNNPRIKFRKIIRTILILPWAIPGFVSILMWRGMLNTNFGIVNQMLNLLFNLEPIRWLQEPFWARTAILLVNLWLGFSYCMILITGILQSIPVNLYEAAMIDGAGPWQKFRYITIPLLLFSIAPLMIMTFAFNFNNFTLIYLLNGGGPAKFGYRGNAGSTDILISWVFKLTAEKNKYNYASAISLIIFIVLAIFSVYNFTRTKSFQEEEMLQ